MLDSTQAANTLRAAGLRLTPQRRAVIEALVENRTHPTAEEVADRVSSALPGVSMSTIYNTLHEFAQVGLVREIGAAGTLRFDPETTEHGHLVCSSCGTVRDVDLEPSLINALSQAAGVPVAGISMSAKCSACARDTHSRKASPRR